MHRHLPLHCPTDRLLQVPLGERRCKLTTSALTPHVESACGFNSLGKVQCFSKPIGFDIDCNLHPYTLGQVESVQKGGPYVMFGDGQLASCKPISEKDLAKYMVWGSASSSTPA